MKTIFIGPLGYKGKLNGGDSMKNFHITQKLKQYFQDLLIINTEGWKKNPHILLKVLFTIIRYPKAKYILSLNTLSASRLIQILNKIAPKASIIYWVIGSSLCTKIKNLEINPKIYEAVSNIIVEGMSMKQQLNNVGLYNVSVMPNFKPIPFIKYKNGVSKVVKFVFISRINPQKGCDLIIQAVKSLNNLGLKTDFIVDFYGPIETPYYNSFLKEIKSIDNINYKGFLDLKDTKNYNILKEYDAMLFPTFWSGEGCPGVVIDASICGLPIIASDWHLNKDYIKDGETGFLIPPKNLDSLITIMKKIVMREINLDECRIKAWQSREIFNIEKQLSLENLRRHKIV